MSIGGHQSHHMLKDEWITPREIVEKLGPFDLDPCAPITRPWATAKHHYTILDDGLKKEWFGRVWCNPPYGRQTAKWLSRLAENKGIALVFARTETKTFIEQVWNKASGILFIHGRLHFHHVDGSRAKSNSGAPSVLVSYGEEESEILENSSIRGAFIKCWNSPYYMYRRGYSHRIAHQALTSTDE